jgi:DNA-directed RNA polymerase subunit RPC12/RpoP
MPSVRVSERDYACPHCSEKVFSWRAVKNIGAARPGKCPACGGLATVSRASVFGFILVMFLPLVVGLALLFFAAPTLGWDLDRPGSGSLSLGMVFIFGLLMLGYKIATPLYQRQIRLRKK